MAGFVLQLYASGILRASLVSAYYAVQPMAALLVGYAVIFATAPPHFNIRGAHLGDLGGLIVIAGLLVTVQEEMRSLRRGEATGNVKERDPLLAEEKGG